MASLRGWESYPENLEYQGSDAFGYNLPSYCKQIQSDAHRLFIPETDDIAVKVLEFDADVKDFIIRKSDELETYLGGIGKAPLTRIFLIPQPHSWSRLNINESSARKILSRFSVFPPFIDIIRAFGEKTGFEDSSFGGLRFRPDSQTNGHETAYLMKHVEEHGRPDHSDPWSMRQMGVYHKSGGVHGELFIVINPSLPFRQRLKTIKQSQRIPSPDEVHLTIQSSCMDQWRWYISRLELRYFHMFPRLIGKRATQYQTKITHKTKIGLMKYSKRPTDPNQKDKAQLAPVDTSESQEAIMTDIRFEDTQEVQVLQDKCHQVAQLLGTDRTILQSMPERSCAVTRSDPLSIRSRQQEVGSQRELLMPLLAEANVQMNRVESLLERLRGTIALLRTIVDFRCLRSLEHNSSTMAEVTRLSQVEGHLMTKLTKKAARDTEIMKILTILALVYLPASFVSSMMGMGYVNVHKVGKQFSIHFESEFSVFAVITSILLLVNILFYGLWIRRTKPKKSEDFELTPLLNV